MDIRYSKERIEFEKELNSLDKFAIGFISLMEEPKLNMFWSPGMFP